MSSKESACFHASVAGLSVGLSRLTSTYALKQDAIIDLGVNTHKYQLVQRVL
jgi:hypothetical protein